MSKLLRQSWMRCGESGLTLSAIAAMSLFTLSVWVVAASAAEVIYVPMGSDNKIVLVDPSEDRVVGEITGVTAVHGLATTPDGRYLIAGSFQERDPDGGAPDKPAAISEEEHAAHHKAPAPTTAKTVPSVSTLSIISTADGSIAQRIDVPGAVHHVAASPDGRFALVTHPGEGIVSVINLSTRLLLATIETGPLPNYAAFAPDSSRVFVSNAGNNTATEIDTQTWTVQRKFPTGASPEHLVLSRDGTRLYVNNVDEGMVSSINLTTGEVAATYAVGPNLHGIDVADNDATLFVASRDDDKVVAIDLDGGSMRSVALKPAPYHLATIRGFNKIYISSADDPKLWVLDQKTLEVLGEIPIGGKGHQIVQGVGG